MADQPEYYNISEGDIVYKERSPKVVNGYLMGDIVGKGSYAKVKEAIIVKEHTDFEFGAHVAIKITHQRQLRKIPGGQEAVEREIKFLKKLHHQNIVRFVEFFQQEEKGKIYLVLEYVNGGTLQELIDRAGRPLSMAQARMYFRHILSGLDYIHKQGFVHRDIKPANLMLSTDNVLKISDFGVAELLDVFDAPGGAHKSKTHSTPAFQPPEVASCVDRISGEKVDLWAAGVTLYFITTGKFPFEGNTIYQLFESIASGVYDMPDSLEPDLADLIRCILILDFQERFTIRQILQHRWMAAAATDGPPGPDWVPVTPFVSCFKENFDAAAFMRAYKEQMGEEGSSSAERPEPPKHSKAGSKTTGKTSCCVVQ
mmetsp:Transcript_11677/g.29495  ORF Transcript_11677/g.29495 Transcript_11677/m.29495 type:complete len:370 (-) Transcript_11677:59-1168(-)|eukprot:CAMPEP_0177634556 /NCGR_PEP_ID=MMETSP0447-20121125/3431_1 /TAXON_ID=0 /ORGANISM="Stygamoeba regulata, Strain BSH-02190019" /LENGTH=369 /DNA_ID=CAMNT_0019136285 /DNA_START=337 /DNA_END=1446 /DNA_ORIENTATION=+